MQASYIWMNGELVPWDRAQVHVLSHALHYGTSVFEGLRAYDVADSVAVFCGPVHFERLLFSCKVLRLPSPLTVDQWMTATLDTLRANRQRTAYIRPLVFRGPADSLGLDSRKGPVQAIVATVPWGTYLGDAALEQGVDVQVSSWRRSSASGISALAKIGGQYINSQAIVMEAHDNGFTEGIALDAQGHVSEGSAENIFLVHAGQILTPPVSSSILSGVTRNCVITIAGDLGYSVQEMTIPREMLYLADEIFFTGTAAEVCPVRSVDRIPVGQGRRGPITKAIQDAFFGIVTGTQPDTRRWLTPVDGTGHERRP
jgi:branched-chain amino acid aminotransferase